MRIFLILLILTPFYSRAESAAFKVRSYNRIFDRNKITLKDIVETGAVSPAVEKRLKSVVLGDAPRLGEQRVYTNKAIAEAIRQSQLKEKWSWQIPHQVVVENRGFELDHETVENELVGRWKSLCKACEVRVKRIQIPALPAYLAQSPWILENDNKLPRGNFSQKLVVKTVQGRDQIFWINGEMEVKSEVPVLTRSVTMGTRLSSEDFVTEWRDVTYATDTTPSEKEIIGQKAKYTMNANDIVWRGSLVREKAVERGEIVKVIVGEGNWQISMQAMTEQDGFVGDTINVRNLQTKRILTGRVVGSGEVEVR